MSSLSIPSFLAYFLILHDETLSFVADFNHFWVVFWYICWPANSVFMSLSHNLSISFCQEVRLASQLATVMNNHWNSSDLKKLDRGLKVVLYINTYTKHTSLFVRSSRKHNRYITLLKQLMIYVAIKWFF